MILRRLYLFALLAIYTFSGSTQNTLGTIYNSSEALDGYTFFSPFSGTKAYMVDNCGRLVNVWDRGTRPGLAAYFLDNGMMLRTYKVSPVGPFTSASNAGGLELVDWDNNTVWSYEFNTSNMLSHHDAVMMPNGNILLLTWELITADELITLGRDPTEISAMGFAWNEKIIEIRPIGNDDIEMVWEWKMKDHYIQDFDDSKDNFGIVGDHPELFDINLPDIYGSDSHAYADYNHFNAIDYNVDLDQILISVRNSDEIWVIDHSTNSAEAATHQGGKYGKGGDILYRWGNPAAYRNGSLSDQQLFGQHGANWIRDANGNHRILLFNNGNGRVGSDYSTGEIIDPPFDTSNNYVLTEKSYGPEAPTWIYGEDIDQRKLSSFLSNTQLLPNGNILMNYGSLGEFIEIDENENIVWQYIIPLSGDNAGAQGQRPTNNATFRAYKFNKDFGGFDGIDIEIGETIERGTDTSECDLFTSIDDIDHSAGFAYTHNMQLVLQSNSTSTGMLTLYNMSGKRVYNQANVSSNTSIHMSHLNQGLYLVLLRDDSGRFLFSGKISLF